MKSQVGRIPECIDRHTAEERLHNSTRPALIIRFDNEGETIVCSTWENGNCQHHQFSWKSKLTPKTFPIADLPQHLILLSQKNFAYLSSTDDVITLDEVISLFSTCLNQPIQSADQSIDSQQLISNHCRLLTQYISELRTHGQSSISLEHLEYSVNELMKNSTNSNNSNGRTKSPRNSRKRSPASRRVNYTSQESLVPPNIAFQDPNSAMRLSAPDFPISNPFGDFSQQMNTTTFDINDFVGNDNFASTSSNFNTTTTTPNFNTSPTPNFNNNFGSTTPPPPTFSTGNNTYNYNNNSNPNQPVARYPPTNPFADPSPTITMDDNMFSGDQFLELINSSGPDDVFISSLFPQGKKRKLHQAFEPVYS